MNTAKVYQDQDGNDCTIHQMVEREPHWAAARIQAGEDAIDLLRRIKEWDIEQYIKNDAFTLPQELRKEIKRACA